MRYQSTVSRDDTSLRQRMRELALEHPRWGALMLIWRLRREGVMDNHKRIRRLYRLEGLAVRRQRRKRVSVARVPLPAPTPPNEQWAMDFMRDTLSDGRAFRLLTPLMVRVTRSVKRSEILPVAVFAPQLQRTRSPI